jgi:HEAT repeat protein
MRADPRDEVEARCTELADRLASGADVNDLPDLILSLGRLNDQRALGGLIAGQSHPSAAVRRAAAEAIPMAMIAGEQSGAGVDALIGLCADADPEVRDWAACSLGRTLAANPAELHRFYDTPRIRAALIARLDDPDPATRAEACAGLAVRRAAAGDIVGPLRGLLARPDVGRVPVIAAEALGSAELYDSLLALRSWWTRDPDLLERAIHASEPGDVARTPRSQHGR